MILGEKDVKSTFFRSMNKYFSKLGIFARKYQFIKSFHRKESASVQVTFPV